MYVEPYTTCQDCGQPLEATTVYQRHAYCGECNRATLA
jgi:Zn finger protein HypA/HybF involved in hydrogenase expression